MTQTMQRDLFPTQNEPESQATGLFADVVFDRPLDHAFTYAVGESLRDTITVGKRIKAPFGRGDKATVGYCVRLSETPPARDVKEILEVLDAEALFDDNLLRLTRWMADYYMCGWGQVLHAVVPAGARDKAGTRARTFLEPVPQDELPAPLPATTPKQAEVLGKLRDLGRAVEIRELTRLAQCGSGPVEALVSKGLVRRATRRVDQSGDSTRNETAEDSPVTLNQDQQQVWSVLEGPLRQGGFQAFLLHGVTGSGKTEVYLRAIEEVLRQGKEVLVLVPEISLTPQTIQRFRGRCGEVAVLHSHLGNAERGGQWRRVANGKVHVVVGARSAVFAPTRRLGLIVIDEEHETTFKQESTPRYHARDVAVMRARLENIPIILGSATPSLESFHNAQRGQYTLLSLPQRVLERPLPPVVLVDRRHDRPEKGRFPALSETLEVAMRQTLKEGGQVMLLLNRRGWCSTLTCWNSSANASDQSLGCAGRGDNVEAMAGSRVPEPASCHSISAARKNLP